MSAVCLVSMTPQRSGFLVAFSQWLLHLQILLFKRWKWF